MKAVDTVNKHILENLYEGVLVFDDKKRVTYCNPSVEEMVGIKHKDMLGSHCRDILPLLVNHRGVKFCDESCPVFMTLSDGHVREKKGYLRLEKNIENIPVLIRVAPIRNLNGDIIGAVKVLSDNSSEDISHKEIEELRKLALLDSLTGLANRRYIEMNIVSRLDEMERYSWPFGLLFIDIDHFKEINDRYGHDAGDEVLKSVAAVLKKNSRSFDLIGRLGGEEFVVNLVNINHEHLNMIADRFRQNIEQSSVSKEKEAIQVTVSIGGTLARKGDTVDSLLNRADRFMYESKRSGRNTISIEPVT